MIRNIYYLVKKFQIKYAFEGFEERNNFTYWNFSKFMIEIELKIKKALGLEIQWNLIAIFKN
jgi:hypothetical protein